MKNIYKIIEKDKWFKFLYWEVNLKRKYLGNFKMIFYLSKKGYILGLFCFLRIRIVGIKVLKMENDVFIFSIRVKI